jgi:hypothetical protein
MLIYLLLGFGSDFEREETSENRQRLKQVNAIVKTTHKRVNNATFLQYYADTCKNNMISELKLAYNSRRKKC